MRSELHCPSCGHHIGSLDSTSEPASTSKERRTSAWMDAVAAQVGRFIAAVNEQGVDGMVPTHTAGEMYRSWCKEVGEPEASPQAFGRAMRANGVMTHRSSGQRFYRIVTKAA